MKKKGKKCESSFLKLTSEHILFMYICRIEQWTSLSGKEAKKLLCEEKGHTNYKTKIL